MQTLDNKSILSAIADEKLGYAFGKPERVNDNSLSVVLPILRDSVIPRSYTTFPETDKLKVHDSGHISVVKATNENETTVYIRSGTIFKGQTQERTAVRSTIVLPGATVEIQVRCVHHSRGISPNAKVAYGGTIPLDMETLTLVPPLNLALSDHLNCLHDGSGTDYFFDQNGHYDGFGYAVPAPDGIVNTENIVRMYDDNVSRIQDAREIEDATDD